MNFQQLRSVREAVRCRLNLTEAARALHTSQPGVSPQNCELEEELGVPLFTRRQAADWAYVTGQPLDANH